MQVAEFGNEVGMKTKGYGASGTVVPVISGSESESVVVALADVGSGN